LLQVVFEPALYNKAEAGQAIEGERKKIIGMLPGIQKKRNLL